MWNFCENSRTPSSIWLLYVNFSLYTFVHFLLTWNTHVYVYMICWSRQNRNWMNEKTVNKRIPTSFCYTGVHNILYAYKKYRRPVNVIKRFKEHVSCVRAESLYWFFVCVPYGTLVDRIGVLPPKKLIYHNTHGAGPTTSHAQYVNVFLNIISNA